MQAFICEVVRALMKLGMAIAANRPIMATTIMISTNVKPDLREVLMFILCLSFCLRRERSNGRVSIITTFVHSLPVATALHAKQYECHARLRAPLILPESILVGIHSESYRKTKKTWICRGPNASPRQIKVAARQ